MNRYEYLIVGGGCAGLSLAEQLIAALGKDTSILIVDQDTKQQNDRSWACWTTEDLPLGLEAIVHHRWSALVFADTDFYRRQELGPYQYQFIRGIDYYAFLRKKLAAYPNVVWKTGFVEAVGQTASTAWLSMSNQKYEGDYLFDSRAQLQKKMMSSKHYFLWQHFRGITIEVDQPIFDDKAATLMDFREGSESQTAFYYVLPFSPYQALIEYTVFSTDVDPPIAYEKQLEQYCQHVLGITSYRVLEREKGKIPMTNAPLYPTVKGRIHPIGTAAGQVKSTTGYAFLRIHAHNARIVTALKQGLSLPVRTSTAASRFAWYDDLLLRILCATPDQGALLFSALFRRNKMGTILRFLDEKSSVWNELSLFAQLPKGVFLQAALHHAMAKPITENDAINALEVSPTVAKVKNPHS